MERPSVDPLYAVYVALVLLGVTGLSVIIVAVDGDGVWVAVDHNGRM